MARVIFHIDLNAFFVSAEELLDPSLKGKAVIISGRSRRSVVSTASYKAREYGIHSAMPVTEAMKLCRDLVIVNGHYSWYSELSQQFMTLIRSYTDKIEQASIDECYADMTDVIKRYTYPLDLAWEIQKRLLNETGLPCSIGVAPNMFLAKMASDMKKPLGITVLRIRDIREKMWPLPIGEMRGVGLKTVPLLEEIGIHTIGDLANIWDIEVLRPVFGKNTEEIVRKANGHDDREITSEWDAKSMGVSETLLEDVTEYEEIRGLFRALAKKLSQRLKKEHKAARRISVRICYYDFRNVDRSRRVDMPVWRADDLFVNALFLFDEHYEEGDAVRLLGISCDDFADPSYIASQLNLFNEEVTEDTEEILDDLNRSYGRKAFVRASRLLEEENEH